jgi:hypothetical protein
METLRWTLSTEKYEVDDRVPETFFTFGRTTWGIMGTEPWFWFLAFAFLLLQSIVNMIVGWVVYTFIVKHQGSSQSYLVGYGVICPLLLCLPIIFVQSFDLHNMVHLCCFAFTSPALLTFRCLEAMHGVLPSFVFNKQGQPCLSKFITYYAASIQFNFDPKTDDVMPLTTRELSRRLGHFGKSFIETVILCSLLVPRDYRLFPQREIQSLVDLFYWGNICNNFLMASFTGSCLEAGITGLGLLTSLVSGISTSGFNDAALLRSSSPSDFWGRRWNRLVGSALRRGVFKPLRRGGFSRGFASFMTFVASGLLHEYILYAMTFRTGIPNNPENKPYVPSYGRQSLFFVWNGIILIAERFLDGTPPIRWMQKNVPKPVRTALVLLTVLPVGHLFVDEYIRSCFYSDISMGFPQIVRVE